MPDEIIINPENLEIGQSIKVKDLDMPNMTILDLPGAVVASVKTLRAVVVEEEVEEGEEGEEGAEGTEGGEGAEGTAGADDKETSKEENKEE